MKRKKTNMRRESDRVIFNMVHNLEKMVPHIKAINDHISLSSEVCPARKAYLELENIFNKVIGDGCNAIKEAFDE